MKCKELLNDIKSGHIFRNFVRDVYTIKYQKRNLLHIHILVFLSPDHRNQLLQPEIINHLISAELLTPNVDSDGHLSAVIQFVMLHEPCGLNFPDAPCMVIKGDGLPKVCSKRFPKPYSAETVIGDDGYPVYRRYDNEQVFTKRVNG